MWRRSSPACRRCNIYIYIIIRYRCGGARRRPAGAANIQLCTHTYNKMCIDSLYIHVQLYVYYIYIIYMLRAALIGGRRCCL